MTCRPITREHYAWRIAVTATMSTPGQNGALTFSGTASQRVSLLGTNGLGGQVAFALRCQRQPLKPDGSVLAAPGCMEGGGFIDATTLPMTGTYRVRVDPRAHSTGSLTFNLYSVTRFH